MSASCDVVKDGSARLNSARLRSQAAHQGGDESGDGFVGDGFVGDQEPVAAGAPELVGDDTWVDVGA